MPFIIDPPHPAMAAGSRARMRFADGSEGDFVAVDVAGALTWYAVDAPDVVDFDAEDIVTVSGRGTLLVGRCPIRVLRACPTAYLRKVRARGKVYEVRAVERHATMSEWIEVGAPIGVLIGKEVS